MKDNLLSVTCIIYNNVNFRKYKGKVLKEHFLKDIVSPGTDTWIEEIQEEHR